MDTKRKFCDEIITLVGNPDLEIPLMELLGRYAITSAETATRNNAKQRVRTFLAAKKIDGVSKRTLGNYNDILSSFISHVNKGVAKITVDDIRDYIGILSDRGLKDSSIQAHIGVIRHFFGWLQQEGAIKKNPMVKIKSLKIDKKNSRHALSQEDLERLRDACVTYKEKALVEFMVSSGCRLSELTSIKVQDIDFLRRSVKVIGKGGKERTVYFSVRAKLMVDAYLSERKGGTALFASKRTPYDAIQSGGIQRALALIGRRADLPHKVHPHLLRHTFATHALNSGMDIAVIQRLLGHEDLSTTQIYAELSHETVRHEYDKFVA